MANAHENFDNKDAEFNIYLEENGDLSFKANGKSGVGDTRMVIVHGSAQLAVGGAGRTGQLQLKNNVGLNTIFVGEADGAAHATLGGGDLYGRVQLNDSSHRTTIDLDGSRGFLTLGTDGSDGDLQIINSSGALALHIDGDPRTLTMFDSSDVRRVELQGDTGRMQLLHGTGVVTADLQGDYGILTLGGANATDGNIFVLDSAGKTTITCNGFDGEIDCTNLIESSDVRFKTGIAPLQNALENVLALRGVRYQRLRNGVTAEVGDEVGFIGQEVEQVCPELVATDAEGYRSVRYTRMTAMLVEAVKEQQRLIREQATALSDALRRIAALEEGDIATRPVDLVAIPGS